MSTRSLLNHCLIILILVIITCIIIHAYKKKSLAITAFQVGPDFNFEKSDEISSPFNIPDIGTTSNFTSANLILFSDYSMYDQHFPEIVFPRKNPYYIMALYGIDLLANKAILCQRLKNTQYIPKTWILADPQDMNYFDGKEKLYILKKNVQRQTGNLITSDMTYIKTKALEDRYILVQELLQNPWLVNGRKINIRIYLLVATKGQTCDFFIYNDGFMYYTPEKFKKESLSSDHNITTGYVDRRIYAENPLTLHDLFKHIGQNDSKKLWKNIKALFREVKRVYESDIIQLNKSTYGTKFAIFGCDIAPDDSLNVKIMEINKGPDLSGKDERDSALKSAMVLSAFQKLGIVLSGSSHDFEEI
jgi:hypothetical protein